jgi:hypothetical protein
VSAAEIVLLLACGAVAAMAVGLVKLGLGIPGHAIVLASLPMAFGIAVAPRRLAGSVMSAGALGTALLLTVTRAATYGSGAVVSLSLLGPMMDIALRRARGGRWIYAALLAAGVAANVAALGSRSFTKILGLDVGSRPFDSWWLVAIVTYTASGAVAGLVGALCWFQLRDRVEPAHEP